MERRAKWVVSKYTLMGLPVMELCTGEEKDGAGEWALQLKRGEVFQYSDTQYGVWVHEFRAANRLIAALELKRDRRKRGEEIQFQIPKDPAVLAKVIKVLGPMKAAKVRREFIGEISSISADFRPDSRDLNPELGQGHPDEKRVRTGGGNE